MNWEKIPKYKTQKLCKILKKLRIKTSGNFLVSYYSFLFPFDFVFLVFFSNFHLHCPETNGMACRIFGQNEAFNEALTQKGNGLIILP